MTGIWMALYGFHSVGSIKYKEDSLGLAVCSSRKRVGRRFWGLGIAMANGISIMLRILQGEKYPY